MRTNKGITLIALVITIIVLLILAGVSIATLTGKSGILVQAQKAKEETRKQAAKEKVEIAVIGSYEKNGQIDLELLKENLNEIKEINKSTIPDRLPSIVEVDTYKIKIKKDGTVVLEGEEGWDIVSPIININIDAQYENSVRINVNVINQTEEDGEITFKYYIKIASASDDTYELKYTGIENSYEYVNIESFGSYMLKVEAIDISGNIGVATKTAGTSCFLAGTQVLTETGMKNIEDIVIGEKVYSINTDNNQRELKEVSSIFRGYTNETYELEIRDELVKTTPKHQFYIIDKGWLRAYELQEGDEIVAKDNSNFVIEKIEHKFHEEAIPVYNLTVEGYHNYLITTYELLVHNAPSVFNPSLNQRENRDDDIE